MPRSLGRSCAVGAALLASAIPGAGNAADERPLISAGALRTAVIDPPTFAGRQSKLGLRRVRGAGATHVRLVLSWRSVAPQRVPGDRTDPENEAYSWKHFDAQVRNARAAGLTPIVCITEAPEWARDKLRGGAKTTWPKVDELARFAEAAAWRYSGVYEGAPKVRIWQVWNEPNARTGLKPQFRDNRPVSPAHYRRMVNAFARSVRRVAARSKIVAGGLSPFGHNNKQIQVVAPLRFMRELFCESLDGEKTCDAKTTFDVWSHHPYTTGGPTHSAARRDDVSLGDLSEMRRQLERAARDGRVVLHRELEFWITEFSWDSQPADPAAVPAELHARWVSEALYRMWQARVSLVTWFLIRDTPLRLTPYQSGLWSEGGGSLTRDRPKLSLRAFRFPFVALKVKKGVRVWGRLPHGARGRVEVERLVAKRWRPLATVEADRYGIFRTRLRGKLTGPLRARWLDGPASEVSVPFALKPPASRRGLPFGCGGDVRCNGTGASRWVRED